MTLGAVVALTLLELEDKNLLTLVLVDDLGGDLLVLEGGRVNDGLLAVVQEENVELATLYCLPPGATIAYMCVTLHCWRECNSKLSY